MALCRHYDIGPGNLRGDKMNRIGNAAKIALCFAMLGGLADEAGAQKVLEQWALAVTNYSSGPSTSAGSGGNILGSPNSECNTTSFDWVSLSWRPFTMDNGEEWIELRYRVPVYASSIEIFENLGPGAITGVFVRNASGDWHIVWQGDDSTSECGGALKLEFPALDFASNEVRIELNTQRVPGWNQLDAVKLVGFHIDDVELLFEEVEESRIYTGGMQPPDLLASYTFGDYDNDGWPDLFATSSTLYPKSLVLLHNEQGKRWGNRVGVLPVHSVPGSNGGGLFGDYDNDGDQDLYITNGSIVREFYGSDILLRNDGMSFVDVSRAAGFADSIVSAEGVWVDYDRDGHLDIYVSHGSHNKTVIQQGGTGRNSLYRNNGDGTFSDVVEQVGLNVNFIPDDSSFPADMGTTVPMFFSDFNGDGWPDLHLSNAFGRNRIFFSDGEGKFYDATTDETGHPGYTVGAAVGDIDNDGDLDLFQASVGGSTLGNNTAFPERSAMLLNIGEGEFLDVTEGVGLGPLAISSIVFARLFDIDNDADLDLLAVLPFSLWLNNGDGTFVESTYLSGLPGAYAAGDFDNDGFLDLWFMENLYRNRGNNNHYLRIDLVGTASNRDGIGAKVLATTGEVRQMRELIGGDGLFRDEYIVHFGLGEATQVDQLEVRWPSGQIDLIDNIPADQEIRVIEGRGEWYPAPRTVWMVEPPSRVTYGQEVNFVAEVRPALFEPRAEVTSITADLSSLGGPESVPLEDLGDGTYRLETRFAVGGSAELRDVEVFIEQATTLGSHWINLSRNIAVEGDPNTAIIVDYSTTLPDNFILGQNYPNPFNSATVIRFALPVGGDVDLAIYNLAGQQVAKLVEGVREAGTYTVRWDGRDDSGRELASGVYLYQLRTGDGQQQVETRKLLLVR